MSTCVSRSIVVPSRPVCHTKAGLNRPRVIPACCRAHSRSMAGLSGSVAPRGLFSSSALSGVALTLQVKKHSPRSRGYATTTKASLFGVGAPEALVIGVVALLVFGPKGLAEAARSLGKTLRAFQPTIRELQEVSSEFKNTLEQEIGYEELKNEIRGVTAPTPKPAKPLSPDVPSIEEQAKQAEDVMKIEPKAVPPVLSSDDSVVTDDMKAKAAAAAWGTESADAAKDVVDAAPVPAAPAAPEKPKEEKSA